MNTYLVKQAPSSGRMIVFLVVSIYCAGCLAGKSDSPFDGESAPLVGQTTPAFALAFSPDGKLLAAGGAPWDEHPKVPGGFARPGELYLWDWRTNANVVARAHWEPNIPAGAIRQYPYMAVAFSPDGKTLVAGGTDTPRGDARFEFTGYYYFYNAATGIQGQVGTRLGVWEDRTLKVEEREFNRLWHMTLTFLKRKQEQRQINRLWQLAISPDGKAMANTSDQHTVKIDDVRIDGNYVHVESRKLRNGPAGISTCLAFAPDSKVVATGGSPDKKVKLLDVTPGREIAELTSFNHDAVVSWVGFTSDGQTLAATDDSGLLKLWDVAQRQERHTIQAHPGEIGALAVSPDGKLVATGGDDKTIKLWDITTGKEVKSLPNQKGRIQALAFSPDSKILASSACDVGKQGEVRLWDLAKVLGW